MKKILYISAGAGSGKTTKIVNMLVAILKNNQDIKTSDIMMTTFSRAAAFEMRERTRQGLLKEGMTKQASELDAASIGTIHSVCLKFLQKYWYLAGISPDPKQLEEDDFETFADKSINLIVSDSDIQQFEAWRKELDITKGLYHEEYTTYWRDMLRKMVEKVRYYNMNNLSESRKLSVEEIQNCFAKHQFSIKEYNKMKDEYIADNATDTLKGTTNLTKNATKRLTDINSYDPIESKFEKFPKSSAQCIKEISRKMELYVKSGLIFTSSKEKTLLNIVNKLFDILENWRTAFESFKKENHLLDYNDMELMFQDLLSQPEVREEIASQYKLIMVDEYQDCNTIQVNIFDKLSDLVATNSPLENSSIWVGDSKQAIYGFRGSDTELTKSIGDEIHDKENKKVHGFKTDALKHSFRSRKELVELANAIFLPIFSGPEYKMPKNEITLDPGRLPGKIPGDDLDKSQKSALHWDFSKLKSADIPGALARQIKAMVESGTYKVQPKKGGDPRSLQYEDIAVLCRNNYAVSKLANCLLEIGVPVCAPEADIFSRIEVQLMLALLQYAKTPKYRRHIRLDIIHILKNESTEDILKDYSNYIHTNITIKKVNGREIKVYPQDWRSNDQLIQLVEKIAKECYAKNMHDTLATFIDRMRLMDVVNRWGDVDIRKDNITNLLQKAAKYDTHCEQLEQKDDQQNFSKFSQYLIESDNKTETNLDRQAVKVITYHKSKGLDWPMVILNELGNKNLEDTKIAEREFSGVREQKKTDGSYWLRVFPSMGKILDKDAAEILSQEQYFQNSKIRLLKEEARLFYVGVTRARDILVFVTEKTNDWMENILQLGAGNNGLTCSDLISKLKDESYNLNAVNDTKPVTDYQEIDIQKLESNFTPQPYLLNPSKVKTGTAPYTTQIQDVPNAAFTVNKTDDIKMNTIGTCIHNIYAAYNPEKGKDAAIQMAENIIKAYGLDAVLNASPVINSIKLLYEELKKNFGESKSIKHEVPFTLLMEDDQLLHGEIDLLWETKDGVVLVDFKNIESDTPNPEHYFSQMSAYEKAITKANLNCCAIVLYYANQGKMVTLKR